MSLFKTLSNAIPNAKALVPVVVRDWPDAYLAPNMNTLQPFGGGVVLYPENTGDTFIRKGYKKNAIVFSIVNKCAKKFAQVPWYHYRIKSNERKTWAEYEQLTKDGLHAKSLAEARKMRQKAIEQVIVDSPLSKRLAKPNRNQNGVAYREQLYTYKLLTGEGNTWYSRGFNERTGEPVRTGAPLEQLIIPKGNLNLVKGTDAWDIAGYEINISGERHRTPKENINMWIFNNPEPEIDGATLSHLRGLSPLQAALLQLQGTNEGGERLVNMNKNQGAAGFAYNKALNALTPDQTAFMRQQFDSIINSSGMAGKYTVMGGEWGVHQLGFNVDELKILEQMDVSAKWLCAVFDFPYGLFEGNQTYANKVEDKRNLVYDNVAPAAYSLRDEWNAELIPAYNLDRERDVIDCAVADLPELTKELNEQVTALKDANWLTLDEKRVASGYEALNTPESTLIFMPAGLQTLEDAAAPMGGPLDTAGLD